MAGTACAESAAGRSMEGLSSVHDSQYGEAMTEWRSSEQVENGMPSTSPPYWNTDDSDDDGGPKLSDLYGKYTWKIEKFSTINKRELKSNAFEIGGYKWYILIYPQGCDVCNHLSLFLCVANHDKLLPGWSHLAQFTIAVVNKDPKKSKYSDTLHRFWKKEHDWGWKKFMELSKVSDGFVDADTLIVKAQVQVVREREDRPFRCLHSQYRREFVRVYLTNVEQICRRFVDDKRDKLGKLLEDKARWSSFCAFWREIDQTARHIMSREKMGPILKMIVKHFFLEKEVTSTLVMDSLYSGLKALEGQSECILGKAKAFEGEDIAAPVVQLDKDMFILVDDVLSLLPRATMDPLPPKDEKGPQNRTKDGGSGEDFYKDSIERDERRLTELGRRTVEIYVLTHIFSKIEAAYQEAVSLRRQEELIREEKAESEQKAKRVMAEKEKRSKKKQGKQKRNSRKAKDKVKDEKPSFSLEKDKHIQEYHTEDVKDSLEGQTMVGKDEAPEDASETSDSAEGSTEFLQPDIEDREASPVHWDTDASVVHLSAEASGSAVGNDLSSLRHEGDNSSSVMEDSSSTCFTDSVPSVVMNGSYRGNSSVNNKNQKSPTRGKNQRAKAPYHEATGSNRANSLAFEAVRDLWEQHHTSSDKAAESIESGAALSSLQEPVKLADQATAKKEDDVIPVQGKPSSRSQLDNDRQPKEKASAVSHLPQSPPRNKTLSVQPKSEPKKASIDLIPERKVACNSMQQANRAASFINVAQTSSISKLDSVTASSCKSPEKPSISRPSSTPLIPASKPAVTPVVSMVQTAQVAPFLSRSASAAGLLGPDSSPAIHGYALQSSRNAILGNMVASSSSSASYPPLPSPSSAANPLPSPSSSPSQSPSPSFSRTSSLVPGPVFFPRATEVELKSVNSGISYRPSPSSSPSQSPSPSFSRTSSLVPGPVFFPRATEVELKSVNSGISYSAAVARDVAVLSARQQWLDSFQREAASRSIAFDPPSMLNDIQNVEPYNRQINPVSHEIFQPDLSSSSTSGRQMTQGASLGDEFPHLDIINDLLDDEQQGVSSGRSVPDQRWFSFPADMGMSGDVGLPTGSCRFERNRGYHEHLFQSEYALPSNHYDTLREYIPQSNMMMPYMNEQIDGLVHNQWQVGGHDLLMPGTRDSWAGDGYLYGTAEYSNLACGLNGYTMFRPSNGH